MRRLILGMVIISSGCTTALPEVEFVGVPVTAAPIAATQDVAPDPTQGRARAMIRASDTTSPQVEAVDETELWPVVELEDTSRIYARRVAVVIGIDKYEKGIPSLESAVSDAESMATALRSMGFDSIHELYDEQATHDKIVDLLRTRIPAELGPQDLLVVYFAGHGVRARNRESFLLPQDASTDFKRRGLTMQYLKEAALGVEARAVLYLVDACLSGEMIRPKGSSRHKVTDEYWNEARRDRVVQIITAGSATESALETNETGLFTGAIRSGLVEAKADENKDRFITVEELGQFTAQQVTQASSDRQHPEWGTIEGQGTVLLFDSRRVPQDPRQKLSKIAREDVPKISAQLPEIHRCMAEGKWADAEAKLRDLLLEHPEPELYLLLAEVYLEVSANKDGAFKNRAIIERELSQAERGSLTENQKARVFEIRRLMKKMVRGGY